MSALVVTSILELSLAVIYLDVVANLISHGQNTEHSPSLDSLFTPVKTIAVMQKMKLKQ